MYIVFSQKQDIHIRVHKGKGHLNKAALADLKNSI